VAWADAFDDTSPDSLVYKLNGKTGRLELTTNTSRILTLDKNIPRVQVNNPDLLAVTPLSANQVQISAKKAGVTQVNLWDEDGNIHSVDVLIYGDVRELQVALATQFPNSSIRVYRYSESLVLKGFIDQPEHVSQVVALASDYAPKVINNITVGGVQQVLLKVKVMEVSRTKLRELGTDWALIDGNDILAASNVSQLLSSSGSILTAGGDLVKTGNVAGQTFQFGVFSGNVAFFGVLDALQQRNVAKILAEPNIVAVSGRPAQFNVGGEFPILVPQSLGTTSIEFKKYGTQVDFLPIVLGSGRIRLEVRPRISEIDPARSVVISGTNIPALTVREVDTAVEMQAGQTFALAGLVQQRTESRVRGLPYVSDLPILGVPFRKTRDEVNEIELLILVTPEFVDAMDPCEVECAGPGYATTSPTDCQLYCAGHVEVPAHCNPYLGPTICGECSQGGCGGGGGCNCGSQGQGESIISDGIQMQGGTGYDDSYGPTPAPMTLPPAGQRQPDGLMTEPDSMPLPPQTDSEPLPPQASYSPGKEQQQVAISDHTVPRPYSPTRQPVFVRKSNSPDNPNSASEGSQASAGQGGLIGPIGYDAE
jgi:pilus assembly protein CpaC